MSGEKTGLDDTKYSLTEHLGELRARIIKALLGIVFTALAAAIYAPEILDYAIEPLQAVLSERIRVEAVVVRPDGATADDELLARLRAHPKVRFRGQLADLDALQDELTRAARGRRPIDLVLVDTDALGADGRLVADVAEDIEPTPFVAYLIEDPKDPLVVELQLEGALVILDPPRRAVVERVLRRAAASAGKAQNGDKLVVLSPLEPFFAYIKIAIVCGLFLACPIWLYQAWAFVAPGLYIHEKKAVLPVVLTGSALFVGGGLFAYYGMFPLMFDVLVNQMMPDSLAGSFTVDKYLGLLLRITVAFGVVFELPLALAMLASLGIVSSGQLRRYRKYAFIVAFVLGAVLTPADPLSQGMMALPLVVFYEVGIIFARIFESRRSTELAPVDDRDPPLD